MDKTQKWMVVGGGGFLGEAIVGELCRREIDVLSVDITFRSLCKYVHRREVASINDEAAMLKLTRGVDVVVNACAVIEGKNIKLLNDVNYLGVKTLLKVCKTNKVRKFIQISSAGVHFDGTRDLNYVNEESPLCKGGLYPYNITKAKADTLTLNSNDEKGLLTVTIRPTSIYGPNDSGTTNELYKLYKKTKNPKIYFGSDLTLCDFTYVDNVVHSVLLAESKMGKIEGVSGNAFLITNGRPVFFWDFCRYFVGSLGANDSFSVRIPSIIITLLLMINVILVPLMSLLKMDLPPLTKMRVALIKRNRYYDITKASEILGYEPLVDNKKGLDKCIEYYNSLVGNLKDEVLEQSN